MAHLTHTVSEEFIIMTQAMSQGQFQLHHGTPIPVTPQHTNSGTPKPGHTNSSYTTTPRLISPVTPSSKFDYSGRSRNNYENNLSSKEDPSGKNDGHTKD